MANAAQTRDRLTIQKQVDMKLKILKTIIRASYDVEALDQKRYLKLEASLYEIGRMLGGWIKTTTTPTTSPQENPA